MPSTSVKESRVRVLPSGNEFLNHGGHIPYSGFTRKPQPPFATVPSLCDSQLWGERNLSSLHDTSVRQKKHRNTKKQVAIKRPPNNGSHPTWSCSQEPRLTSFCSSQASDAPGRERFDKTRETPTGRLLRHPVPKRKRRGRCSTATQHAGAPSSCSNKIHTRQFPSADLTPSSIG